MKILAYLYPCSLSLLFSLNASAASVDCMMVYGASAQCEQVTCNEMQKTFLGTWKGPFQSYSQELSSQTENVFRPFQNTVEYKEEDCLKNVQNGDLFIVGHRTDVYPEFRGLPAETQTGLLITGSHSDGAPFLMTVDNSKVHPYQLRYKNATAVLAIWEMTILATNKSPEYRFTTIDGRDFSDMSHQKRNVVVTMSIGPKDHPVWEGVISSGTHTQQ